MNPTFYLFLDDLRNPDYLAKGYPTRIPGRSVIIPPHNEFKVARDVPEAIRFIHFIGFPSVVALDHDLGEGLESGYDFVKWLVEQDLDRNWMTEDFIYVVHSMSPVGAKSMFDYLDSYYRQKFNRWNR